MIRNGMVCNRGCMQTKEKNNEKNTYNIIVLSYPNFMLVYA